MRPALGERSGRVVAARKLLRRARRDDERLFLAEGPQAVSEALTCPGAVREVFVTETAQDRHGGLVAGVAESGASVATVTDEAARSLSQTVTPQGIVAVCGFVDVPLAQVLDAVPAISLVVVLTEIRDPGNAGTVLRTADAAGAGAVLFSAASVDPYNGKCVRASAGSLFHPRLVRGIPAEEAVSRCRAAGLQVLAADAAGEADLFGLDAELSTPTAWLFGNEAYGLPAGLAQLADRRVRVPILGRAESLNLAAAAAVCLYSSARAQARPTG